MKKLITVLVLIVMIGAFTVTYSATAASVTPVPLPGNPTCVGQGYAAGFKVDPPNAGTYAIDPYNTVTVTTDGVYFDWSSTLGMDAVIVKGGPNSNLYDYQPDESKADAGLHSPINPNTGQPYGLSHIEFCYDYELTVSKTAETSYTRTFNWEIAKSVTPQRWDLFTGDSGTSAYTVSVDKTGYTDSGWAASGEIEIANHTPFPATISAVSDAISGFGPVPVVCGVTFPYELAAGATLTCTYTTALPDGTDRTNTATVTTTGPVGGGSDEAAVDFGDPTTLVNDEINVDDSVSGDLGSFSDDGEVTYEITYTCDGDEGTHENTATIVETGQSDSASVDVACYELLVTKDAETSYDRTYTWLIDKWADQTELVLSPGQQFLVNYWVSVSATSADSVFAVHGLIDVYNPAPIAAELTGVSDIVSPGVAATVDCGVSFPYSLAAGDTLTCSYSAALADTTDRLNTAAATLQNYDYAPDGTATASGTTDFTGTADVSFAAAVITHIDECIDVSDTLQGVLGTVCFNELPKTFTYSRYVGPYETCGPYTYDNTASFVTNDTGATGSDDWSIVVDLPCPTCTLTPGYWKTHSMYGPAPYDDTWALLGEDTPFYLSGKSYYQALWTPPAGNPYYILAHAFIAAKLNGLNGSSLVDVSDAMAWAENFFTNNPPGTKWTKAQRAQITYYASILDQYNNGLIGPGHCDY